MKLLRGVLTATLLLVVAGNANAIILNFEDLAGSGALPSNYHGLGWDPNWNYYDSVQPPYNPSSGVQRIYTHNFGGWITFGQNVTFLGSWVASANQGQQMYWEGYNNNNKIFESAHLLGGAQSYINVNWAGVDEVRFVSTSFDYFVVDDISYQPGAIPEPATLLMLGPGLLGLHMLRRRKRTE